MKAKVDPAHATVYFLAIVVFLVVAPSLPRCASHSSRGELHSDTRQRIATTSQKGRYGPVP